MCGSPFIMFLSSKRCFNAALAPLIINMSVHWSIQKDFAGTDSNTVMSISNTNRKSFLLGVGVSGAIVASFLAIQYITRKEKNKPTPGADHSLHSAQNDHQTQRINNSVVYNTSYVNGKVVLVIGGSTGIGLEMSKELIARGATVYITSDGPFKLVGAAGIILNVDVSDSNSGQIIVAGLKGINVDMLIDTSDYVYENLPKLKNVDNVAQFQQLTAQHDTALSQHKEFISHLEASHSAEITQLCARHKLIVQQLNATAESATVEAANKSSALARESELLRVSKEREKAASERADTLMARAGKSYIKRDVQQTKFESPFPAGDTFLAGFKKDFLGFDTFLNDAANVVEDSESLTQAESNDVVVDEVLVPLHAACAQYVTQQLQDKKQELETKFHAVIDEDKPDTTDAVFWYAHVQPLFLAEVEALTEDFILQTCLCPRARDLHERMKAAVAAGSIEGGEGALTFPRIARLLLRALAVAALSVPRCYLYPAPGQTVQYREGFTKEVLSPGTKKHGRIVEGSEVEVVFSGLYFEKPTAENFNKLTPSEACLVRRVPKKI